MLLHLFDRAYCTSIWWKCLYEMQRPFHRNGSRSASMSGIKGLPDDRTKSVVRFHTPEVLRMSVFSNTCWPPAKSCRTQEREQHKETLAGASRQAFQSFQSDISEHPEFLLVSKQLAVVDCLMSLAQVAAASGYCKPTFVAEPELHIRQGRHPMVSLLPHRFQS